MKKTILLIAVICMCSLSLDKMSVPYTFGSGDTLTYAKYNSNNDTPMTYINSIIDTLNKNVPRYTQNTQTHDLTMPFLNVDTLSDIDSLNADKGYIDTLSVGYLKNSDDTTFQAYCSLYDYSTYRCKNLCTFRKNGNKLTIQFSSYLLGTITGSSRTYIRNASYIENPSNEVLIPAIIVSNSTQLLGMVDIFEGYMVVRKIDNTALDAGDGGIAMTTITYLFQ